MNVSRKVYTPIAIIALSLICSSCAVQHYTSGQATSAASSRHSSALTNLRATQTANDFGALNLCPTYTRFDLSSIQPDWNGRAILCIPKVMSTGKSEVSKLAIRHIQKGLTDIRGKVMTQNVGTRRDTTIHVHDWRETQDDSELWHSAFRSFEHNIRNIQLLDVAIQSNNAALGKTWVSVAKGGSADSLCEKMNPMVIETSSSSQLPYVETDISEWVKAEARTDKSISLKIDRPGLGLSMTGIQTIDPKNIFLAIYD